MRIVMKFGGTSLADREKLLAAAQKGALEAWAGHQVVMVVSAPGHSTDETVRDMKEICPQPPQRESDACLAALEQMSAARMAIALHTLGCEAVSLTGWQAGLLTDGRYGDADILGLCNNRVEEALRQGKIVVVAGFQGLCQEGDITTLGRGGSDTTAVALAAFLGAEDCRIYTDVDGVYDKDPRKFPDAVRFSRIRYDSMLALIRDGAQVLHHKSVELGKKYAVPIRVLSSFRPGPGTWVTDLQE